MSFKLLHCLYCFSVIGSALSLPFVQLSRVNAVPNIFRYSTARSLVSRPASVPTKETQHNNLMTSGDPSYVEQQRMKDDQSDESDLYPIYVLPPPNFQPVIYPTSRLDGVRPGNLRAFETIKKPITLAPPPRPYPYPYPHGFSSWVLGGIRPLQRGSYWEQLSSDIALHNPAQHNVVVYVKGTLPVGYASWLFSGIKTDGKWQNEVSPNSVKPNIKTKLPVGLSSWFLGGMRDLSGRHWKMPNSLVNQVEFMPSNGKPISEDEKKKNEYKPIVVKFDDEQDVYNVIKHEK